MCRGYRCSCLYPAVDTYDRPDPGAAPPYLTTGQQSQFPTSVGLSCQGCHGPGKTLPNLAGEKFHKDAHGAIASSIHARIASNGNPIASCKDCHTKNGDMTTVLQASDPNSTVSRSVIAETCGKCHGDKSTMQGSGISDRPFLSYRESVHAKAMARGNAGAAVCSDCHNSHDIRPASEPQSSIAKINIPTTCGKCHSKEATEFNESVHGRP